MSTFYTNEGSRMPAVVSENFDDSDDDFEEMGDQPLSRPRVEFTPTRDPLVAALFGPVGHSHSDESAAERDCSIVS